MKRREFIASSLATSTIAGRTGARPAVSQAQSRIQGVLFPDLPIIDCHHHLHELALPTKHVQAYTLANFLDDVDKSGHRIIGTIVIESNNLVRPTRPPKWRGQWEARFFSDMAAISASGLHGPCRVGAGIVAFADLRQGNAVAQVVEHYLGTTGGRLVAIRNSAAWDPYPVAGSPSDPSRKDLLRDRDFQTGVAALAPFDLAFETFVYHPQLGDVEALARSAADTRIVLNHVGTPLGVGPYASQSKQVFVDWKASLKMLARCPNVFVKIGGLGIPLLGLRHSGRSPSTTMRDLAPDWKPYVENCIDAFGVDRCMFESNYPPDSVTASYGTIWNTFKLLTMQYSEAERHALFSQNARRTYKLALD